MKKIDFHIHTIATSNDSNFSFSLEQLKKYVNSVNIDAIAITNHNIFDRNQFNQISKAVTIPVFPGIEINLENGHLLLITDKNELSDFYSKCSKLKGKIIKQGDSITTEELIGIFHDLSKYVLIPHYDKRPSIEKKTLTKLATYVTTGEVASPKKFIYCIKNEECLVPVYFSDSKIDSSFTDFPARQTYINCGEITFAAIRNCLRDKNKVSLSHRDGHSTFQIFDDGQELSTGLNVIMGERSSGKSFTLDRIARSLPNVKYLRQFTLVERNEKQDEEKFNKLLSESHSLLTQEYLKEFQKVVNDVTYIDIEEDERQISDYLKSLIRYAKEYEKRDAFSKAKLFREEKFQISDLNGLKQLISSVQHLIENIEYRSIINKYLSRKGLIALILELMQEYQKKEEENLKKNWLNDLISEIKRKLQIRTAATAIEDVNLYQIAINFEKVNKFNEVVEMVRKSREIMHKDIQGFKIVARTSEFLGAGELKSQSRLKATFSLAYQVYKDPYKYLQSLKLIESLPGAEYYRYFAKIQYKILNKDGFEVSGGERSEFNLLQEINDAQRYDMLLIDEPESSFDNLFLKNEVNEIIKEISKNMPVVLVTHNSTVGASIKPNYLLYTKKEVIDGKIEYHIYSGFPTDRVLVSTDGKSLSNIDVTMDCLEAGKQAYGERRRVYEDLEN
ncbi:MAG: hypothetical protein KKH94_02380 [Candidatus Omnitrophica bacterium]|nr:hypothetical protein [Candidatus Omnitrophota bacterium]